VIGLDTPTTLTVSVVGLVAFLAVVALARVVLRKAEPKSTRVRIGFFIERDPGDDDCEPDDK
jgi:hypothetical protein